MSEARAALAGAFRERGRQLWLVGGALRDEMLGRAVSDEDYATDALPDEVEAIAKAMGVAHTTVGKRFGTIGVFAGGAHQEVTTFRGDSYDAGPRWPDVTFGRSIEEDLARRDFTVNGMAEDVHTGRRIDPFGGAQDIGARLLRAIGEPERRFREDPLRILRGMRFASQLDFAIEPATQAAMSATVELLATLSQERVTAELDRLLQGESPGRGLDLLRVTGALALVLPELAPMHGCEQNRFHFYDVWGHTLATVQAIDPGEQPRLRRWAALLHDLGKPAVRHVKANGEWGFYRHESVGAEMAEGMLERLKVGRQESLRIRLLVRRHMDRPAPEDRRSVRRFMAKCEGHWRDLVALKRADNASHTYDDTPYHDLLEAACARAEAEDAAALRAESPLTGNDLVAIFDREPGPWIRRIKQQLSSMVLDGEIAPGDRAAAEAVARRLMGRE
ncbi:MAG: CCA tRNA nucleotidyltransferase [Tepidiformaceae bacterium]